MAMIGLPIDESLLDLETGLSNSPVALLMDVRLRKEAAGCIENVLHNAHYPTQINGGRTIGTVTVGVAMAGRCGMNLINWNSACVEVALL
jgi:hypothetical protein